METFFQGGSEMFIDFEGKEHGFGCGFCGQRINVHYNTERFSDESPKPIKPDCDPLVVEVDGELRLVCHRCATRMFPKKTLRTLSDPGFVSFRRRLMNKFRKRYTKPKEKKAVVFSEGLKSCIKKSKRELATAGS